MSLTPAEVPAGLQKFLLLDHERLANIFRGLIEAFGAGELGGMREAWSRFETGLTGHLEAEERYMLPLFRLQHRAEAEEIAAEHVSIRRTLADLAVGVDLHVVSLEMAKALVASLGQHAAREEKLLYAWAQRELDEELKRKVERDLGAKA